MEVEIIHYKPELQPYFEKLNKRWLEEYFVVEPIDRQVLENPQKYIIDPGGTILFAVSGEAVLGTVALKPVEPGILEMTKMAVDVSYIGLGVGKRFCEAAIETARKQQATRLILYSNTKLAPAIQLYRKMGFLEISLQPGLYQRSDIMMERVLK
jgi:ribosomal protein S18 acetylase RimI-like enzyme